MFNALKSLFENNARANESGAAADPGRALKLAACALLLEMAYADDQFSESERQKIQQVVGRHFGLDAEATQALLADAERARQDATDLYELTSVINQYYDEGQRFLLVELLWRVVDADGVLSEHEDYLSQKIAYLLDLRPGYLSEARKRAKE